MSYALYDSKGFVGDLASNAGLRDFTDFLEKEGGTRLKAFVGRGEVRISEILKSEIEKLPIPTDPDVRKTLENFKILLEKSEEYIIISSE